MTIEELQRLFNFTDDDLVFNRAGRLSPRQQETMRHDVTRAAIDASAVVTILPVIIILIVLYFILAMPLGDRLGAWVCIAIPIIIVFSIAVVRLWWFAARWLISRVMRNPSFDAWLRGRMQRVYAQPIEAVERGVMAKSGRLTHRSDGEHDYLFLNDEELQVSVDAEIDERLWKLPTDHDYTFYTVLGTDWIAAVEIHSGMSPRKAGSAKGQVAISDDFDAPLSDFEESVE